MTASFPETPQLSIRPFQYRDLEAIATLTANETEVDTLHSSVRLEERLQQVRRWYGPLKVLSWFPNPLQHYFCLYVAEQLQEMRGWILFSPFNSSRSTWRVEQVRVAIELASDAKGVGSQLLRYCFETIWEARTWLLEVNIHEKTTLALYRQNGFQPLAQMTYWCLAPELLQELAEKEPDLPNLLPVSNADAQLLYQLDCVSMPPLLRQVFDRHIQDFKTSFFSLLLGKLQGWFNHREVVQGYVFEPQRKAAIGYFKLDLCQDGSRPHRAQLTVHPAYTWLYSQLFAKMAQILQTLPSQSLQLVSADYQHEREEYLEQLGAQRIEHTLMMSRSVWHKLREAKPEGIQLPEVLQGLQAIPRTSIPSRISWLKSSPNPDVSEPSGSNQFSQNGGTTEKPPETPENGHHA
jgi:L-amino acid N-acyltransferase YncA